MSSDEKSGSHRAIKRPQVPPGPLADLKAMLYELYLEAGTPRLDQIEEWLARTPRDASPGRDTVARIIGSATMPPSYADLAIVVTVLARAALWDPDDAVRRARDLWVAARMEAARTPAGGVRVSEADPWRLGVHAAINVPGVTNEVLPEYVPRDVDDGASGIRARVTAASERGGFVLLIGGSSVGKTRSAVEAVTALLPDWWLVHPAGPDEVAALAAAPVPRTVVWLDELQHYLDGEHGLKGGVIRELLNSSHSVVIIATIWPGLYADYTAEPVHDGADSYAREREILELATVVRIGPELSPAERDRARAAAARDRRVAIALGTAGYGFTQTLAAAPQLVARWQDAQTDRPYAWSVITAALDAARLGIRTPLTESLLRAAAPGYCTSRQRAEAPGDWFEQAMAHATAKLRGAASVLAPAGEGMGQITGYIVADYLAQHAIRERRRERVPASTWDAILNYASDPADANRLAISAENRLLYCYAIPLYRHAADAGAWHAAWGLAKLLAESGDLDQLRARAGTGDIPAARCLERLLADRGDLDGLRALAEAGAEGASLHLARLLAERGDLDEALHILRSRADAGDWYAGETMAKLLAGRGDVVEAAQILHSLASAGSVDAEEQLDKLLTECSDVDQLRALADAGVEDAPLRLARLLAERGDLSQLRALAQGGVEYAPIILAAFLAEQGDLSELRALADAGAEHAPLMLARLLADRGNTEQAAQILRTQADADNWYAAEMLAELLTERGDLDQAVQILRAWVEAGEAEAVAPLALLLAKQGDLEQLRAMADAGHWYAASQLAELVAKQRDPEQLRVLADAGNTTAAHLHARLLAERGNQDELRALAEADGMLAASLLRGLLAERNDVGELRALADAGDGDAARTLSGLLVKHGDVDQLRAEVDAGNEHAARQLAKVLAKQGRREEAERLRRFGLNSDGSIVGA